MQTYCIIPQEFCSQPSLAQTTGSFWLWVRLIKSVSSMASIMDLLMTPNRSWIRPSHCKGRKRGSFLRRADNSVPWQLPWWLLHRDNAKISHWGWSEIGACCTWELWDLCWAGEEVPRMTHDLLTFSSIHAVVACKAQARSIQAVNTPDPSPPWILPWEGWNSQQW